METGNTNKEKYLGARERSRKPFIKPNEEQKYRFEDVSQRMDQKCKVLNTTMRMVKTNLVTIDDHCMKNNDYVLAVKDQKIAWES